ncbi:MAG: hypothetical protein AAF363_19210 [Bacteroidota bacterium]
MKHFIVILFLFFTGCTNSRTSEQEPETSGQIADKKTRQIRIFEQPVNLDSIKNLDNIEFTSGVETKTCKIETEGFFGFYGFIDMERREPFANLIVLTTDQPEKWRADSNNEQFVSLELFSRKLIIWDSLRVGLTIAQLNNFINEQFHYKKGQTVYADFDRYEGIFQTRSDTIMSFQIKTKCDSIE